MKESEFIELLNLYVDHEISASDAARLEAEVANNAARRKTYREYCMMHKACDMLAAHYRDPETAMPSFMIERPARSGWGWGAGLVTGGLLAAACLALVFVVHVRQAVQPGGSLAAQPLPPVAANPEAASAFHRAIPAHFTTTELQPVLNIRDLTNPAAGQNELPLAWMNQVEISPIQRTPAMTQLPVLSIGAGANQVVAPAQDDQQIDRVAFQFQR